MTKMQEKSMYSRWKDASRLAYLSAGRERHLFLLRHRCTGDGIDPLRAVLAHTLSPLEHQDERDGLDSTRQVS